MRISTTATQSDWLYSGASWGKPGLYRIAGILKEGGVSRVYWRTHNGGEAMYPSSVSSVSDGSFYRKPGFKGYGSLPAQHFAYAAHIDYREWDHLVDMAGIATEFGIEFAHWATIFEDDHGGGHRSKFLLDHPEWQCTTRDGQKVDGCLDFWFPEVRAYKLRVLDEILAKPGARLLLDFVRRNGKPSADIHGHYRYGFSEPILDAFRKATGLDVRKLATGGADWQAWVEFLTRPHMEFMREAARRARALNRPVDLMVWPVELKTWMAFDLRAMSAEGLVDSVLVGSHRYAASPAEARRQVDALRSQAPAGAVRVVPGLAGYHTLAPPMVDAFCEEAERQGAGEIVLYESNFLISDPIPDHLRAWSFGVPHSRRSVAVPRVVSPDWKRVPAQRGFLRTFSLDNAAPDQETSFQVAHDGEALHVRVECRERNPSGLLPVPEFDPSNFNVAQLRARMAWHPFESVHLFLDAEHRHEDYFHFLLDPSNRGLEERRLDEDWTGPWEHEAVIGADRWVASLRIPFATLGICPGPGQVLGFQVGRIQNAPREVTTWFCAWGRQTNPLQFGHMTLQ